MTNFYHYPDSKNEFYIPMATQHLIENWEILASNKLSNFFYLHEFITIEL